MKSVIHAFGTPASPMDVSSILTDLRVGHTLVTGSLRTINEDLHMAKAQPAWPVVLPSVNAVAKYKCEMGHQILFVCDALARLSTCNLRIIKPHGLAISLKHALTYAVRSPAPDWELKQTEPSIFDFVALATNPSLLNDLQTLLYKISSYPLRKEVQVLVIGYLAGKVKGARVEAKLKTNLKLDSLRVLLKDEGFTTIRQAVAAYRKGQDMEAVAKEYGVQPFEILYIVNSSAKAEV